MPIVATKHFGMVEYEADSAFEFPRGLPGFETRRKFLPLHQPENDPLIFLQSLEDPGLCFLTVPVWAVEPSYDFELDREDADLLGLCGVRPRRGEDVMCLAVLSIREDGPTANLLAPVVVNPANRRCVQAVGAGAGYSHRSPIGAAEAIACS